MNRLEKIPLVPLERVSPSRYTSLKACAYRVVLANTYEHPLLPYAPHGHFGNIIHEAIRSVLTKKVTTVEEFNRKWKELVEVEENKLIELGFDFLVPLKNSMKKGYVLKKMQVRSLLNDPRGTAQITNNTKYSFVNEVWLESPDGLIAGRADLISTINSIVRITDFKSGKILEEEGSIKQNYEEQLKLYAYLYYSMNGRFPNELVLVDLEKNTHLIDFSDEEVIATGAEAKNLLSKTNALINQGNKEDLANPSHENCDFCLYRPACEYHWAISQTESQIYINIRGTLIAVKEFRNGSVNATISKNDNKVIVSNIPATKVVELRNKLNSQIVVFNVFQTDKEGWYKAGKTSMFYEG